MNSNKIPALSENTKLRYANFIALYFAEGLHMGMLFVGIPAWLAMQAKTPTEIGVFAVAGSPPWTFKFVTAPLMDRYAFLPMGRKRPWVIGAQLGARMIGNSLALAVGSWILNVHGFEAAIHAISAMIGLMTFVADSAKGTARRENPALDRRECFGSKFDIASDELVHHLGIPLQPFPLERFHIGGRADVCLHGFLQLF